jgi:hypothetical protein
MNFTWSSSYRDLPVIPIIVRSIITGVEIVVEGLIDTGAEKTLFDTELAGRLALDLSQAPIGRLSGLGGLLDAVPTSEVEITLMFQRELTVRLSAGFVPNLSENFENILGLDLLSNVEFGLSHGRRAVFFGLRR